MVKNQILYCLWRGDRAREKRFVRYSLFFFIVLHATRCTFKLKQIDFVHDTRSEIIFIEYSLDLVLCEFCGITPLIMARFLILFGSSMRK